jgi:hypothetical protein
VFGFVGACGVLSINKPHKQKKNANIAVSEVNHATLVRLEAGGISEQDSAQKILAHIPAYPGIPTNFEISLRCHVTGRSNVVLGIALAAVFPLSWSLSLVATLP